MIKGAAANLLASYNVQSASGSSARNCEVVLAGRKGKPITDKARLEHLTSLAIPPKEVAEEKTGEVKSEGDELEEPAKEEEEAKGAAAEVDAGELGDGSGKGTRKRKAAEFATSGVTSIKAALEKADLDGKSEKSAEKSESE